MGPGSVAHPVIYLANPTGRAVRGAATTVVAGGTGRTLRRSLVVPAGGTVAVDPGAGANGAGTSGTVVVLAGGGVVAEQVVSGPGGWAMAPCASSTSSVWYLAGGATTGGNDLAVTLFNPTASPAVVGLSFDTPGGLVVPQPYQGLVVPPRGLMVEHVGDYVQDQPDVTTIVDASSGQVVADALQQRSSTAGTGLSLLLGAPAAATQWSLAATTDVPGGTVVVHVANPGVAPVTATIDAGLAEAAVTPVTLTVPPQGDAVFRPTSTPRFPPSTPYSLTITGSGPLVVTRTVGAPKGAPAWGDLRATAWPATRWVVPAPGAPGAPAVGGAGRDELAIADTGTRPALVRVTSLAGVVVATVRVPAGSLAVLKGRQVTGLSWLVVDTDVPVVVSADSSPSGAPGVVATSGLQLAG